MTISLDAVSVRVTHVEGFIALAQHPIRSPPIFPVLLLPCTSWLGRQDVLSYFTQTQNICYANGTRFLANKWLLPRQWLFLHFHKHSPYFFQFSKFAKCVQLLHSDMPIQINLFNFFLQEAIKEPRELSLSHRLIQHKRKSYLHSN